MSSKAQKLLGVQLRTVSWQDWQKIDKVERANGSARGKTREKLDSVDEMLQVLDKTPNNTC